MEPTIIVERRPTSVQFFFDPQCPFAYQTSLWIRDVASQNGITVDWRFFSLQMVNHNEDEPYPWELQWAGGWSLMRVGAWLRQLDPNLLDGWYAAIGKAIHEEGRPAYELSIAQQIIEEQGLPDDAIEQALADPFTSEMVWNDHEWLVSTHGGFGVPTLVFPWGQALYGPVVAPAPSGEEALDLWNLVLAYTRIPHLYELKVPKSEVDMARLREVFSPTSRAREAALSR